MARSKSPNLPSRTKPPAPLDLQHNRSRSPAKRFSNDYDDVNEQSPLLPPSRTSREISGEDDGISPLGDDSQWIGDEHEAKSAWYMLLLTLGGFGLQIGWSVEMSNGSPYLLSLGLNKALLALVWIAGPLSGVIVQPYVGLRSDRSRSKYGKRRPFIVGGAIATMFSLMTLAWAREIVSGFLGIFGADPDSNGVAVTIMAFAVLFIYILDFAINVLQAGLRAYAVDCAPHHQQETANAWISRTQGVGNIFGMFCGGLNLPKVLPFFGDSQFKVLCAIATLSIGLTTLISVMTVPERDARLEDIHPDANDNLIKLFRSLWWSLFKLPTQISRVCQVQFLAWIGWFPFLFYTTTYIGEIYVEPFFEDNPHMSKEEVDRIWEAGTRRGTVALLAFAIVTFASSVFLPFFVAPTFQPPVPNPSPTAPLTASGMLPTVLKKQSTIKRLGAKSSKILSRLQSQTLTLRKTWLYSHIFFCACMWLTFVVRSVTLGTILIALVGIPWSITMWAPFALISAEISKRDAIRRGYIRPPPTEEGALLAANEDDAVDQAGVVLGIHNVAVSAPQVIATLAGSLLFKWLQKPRGEPGDESVAWFLRLGAIATLGAAFLTMRVGEENGASKQDQSSGS